MDKEDSSTDRRPQAEKTYDGSLIKVGTLVEMAGGPGSHPSVHRLRRGVRKATASSPPFSWGVDMPRRRRLYVPITRSGSSILASILTQLIEEGRRRRTEEIRARMGRGEITPLSTFVQMHPMFCLLVGLLLMWVAVAIVAAVFGN